MVGDGGKKMHSDVKKPQRGRGFFAVIVILFMMGLILLTTFLAFGLNNKDKFKELGEWGDFFGGIANPILTFLTFIGVLLTLVLQRIELSLTRDELSRSADALENQIKRLDHQNFESTFFQMLAIHNTILNSIDIVNNKTTVRTQGRDCFITFLQILDATYSWKVEEFNKAKRPLTNDEDRALVETAYNQFWATMQSELGHDFRFFHSMLEFCTQNSSNPTQYIKIACAQLSDQELVLIFYNVIFNSDDTIRNIVRNYGVLSNLPTRKLLRPDHQTWANPASVTEREGVSSSVQV
jgi:hypothetical protein